MFAEIYIIIQKLRNFSLSVAIITVLISTINFHKHAKTDFELFYPKFCFNTS